MDYSLLKELTLLNGVSGCEEAVSNRIREFIEPFVTRIETDTMGNLIAFKKGTGETNRRIMVSAHTDEVGFIVSSVTDDGYIKFQAVGGIDDRILLAQRVKVGNDNIDGVIGIKAVHLQTKSERNSVVKIKDMYIDIGAKDKEEALKYVSLGDYIAFNSSYRELGDEKNGVIKAKALDDRIGCAIMCELVKNTYESDIYFCFTVQEEVGLRGASVLARKINPHISIVLESTTASDVADVQNKDMCTRQGEGPALSVMDRASYSNKDLNKFISNVAKNENIPFQYKQSVFGGNDAGAIQTGAEAVATAVLSMPCRYIHSPVSTVRKTDIDNGYKLAKAVLDNINTFEINAKISESKVK